MVYVDGFVVPVPRDKIETYKEQARLAGAVWKEFGALEYVECIGEDTPIGDVTSFPRSVQAKDDEVVIFSWAVYSSRQSRDEILRKIFEDPRMKAQAENMPFDGKRMIYGGFEQFLKL